MRDLNEIYPDCATSVNTMKEKQDDGGNVKLIDYIMKNYLQSVDNM